MDGVYDCDPVKNPGAKLHRALSFRDVQSQRLAVMDETAITLCKENDIPGGGAGGWAVDGGGGFSPTGCCIKCASLAWRCSAVSHSCLLPLPRPAPAPPPAVVVFNLLKPGNVLRAILGDPEVGTHINAGIDKEQQAAEASAAAAAAAEGAAAAAP